MAGKYRSRKRKGTRGPCTYCGKVHRHTKDQKKRVCCGGHAVRK